MCHRDLYSTANGESDNTFFLVKFLQSSLDRVRACAKASLSREMEIPVDMFMHRTTRFVKKKKGRKKTKKKIYKVFGLR